jgi:hypothetical protein
VVAAFGAIVLGGASASGEKLTLEMLAGAARAGVDLSGAFRWVFVAGALFLAAALLAMLCVEERPLRGPQRTPAAAE